MAFPGSWTPGNVAGIGLDPTFGNPLAGAPPAASFGGALDRVSGGPVINIQVNNNYGGIQNVGGFDGGGVGAFSGGGLGSPSGLGGLGLGGLGLGGFSPLGGGLPPGFLSPLSQLGGLGAGQNESDKLFQKTLSDFGKLLEKLLAGKGKGKKGKKGGKGKKRGPNKSGAGAQGGGNVHVHSDGSRHVH